MNSRLLYSHSALCALLILSGVCPSCSGDGNDTETDSSAAAMYFEIVPAEKSGIHFRNAITETDTFNYLSFQYMYNGGGVAVGDINNDGLSDIYFTGNQVSDKLYLNKGGLKFEDITEKAIGALAADGWRTGVTMADVNADGFLDIYVSRSGLLTFHEKLENLLYLNNGDNTFTERGEEFGLNLRRGTSQSAFFDMDNDGDLDLYVMNKRYNPEQAGTFENITLRQEPFPNSDMLLENVDGKFVDISVEAGIQNDAYGLGLAISDLNQDGLQDIYVSNDYIQPDFMYINQGDKTFKDEINFRTGHVSQFGMGNDVADFNNDGLVDIMTLDMANADHIASKKNMAGMNPVDFWKSVNQGNQFEYMFNTLQLNNGNGTFSEIAQLSGVSKTDWSWAPLFADFDNDGYKDLFVTNGYKLNVRDNDYIPYFNEHKYDYANHEEILSHAKTTKEVNYFFKNNGDLTFSKVNKDWKMETAVNSNGAAYADLDNDGDLDLVLNNMEETSQILENKLNTGAHYLRIKGDRFFEGAQITVKIGDEIFFQEMHSTRGYLSSVEQILHFGLGKHTKADEVVVDYAGGKMYSLKDVRLDQVLTLKYADAQLEVPSDDEALKLFSEVELLNHLHREFFRDDFEREILLPHKMSQLGPFMSKGDVNGDQLEDIYISGSKYFSGALYVQTVDQKFKLVKGPWEKETEREELGSLFFDADGDGDQDLYVTSGSNEYTPNSDNKEVYKYAFFLQDQLYINDGKGNFQNETEARLPVMIDSDQRVCTADYDKDGDQDLFVGGRQFPGQYPSAPASHLLRNDKGVFTDVTGDSPDLMLPGMITQSLFDDFDGDKDLDLICVGEWMPVSFFENEKGKFKNVTSKYNLSNTVGWWMSVEKGDFNGDNVNDYVLGNAGENNKFHPTEDHPLEIYVWDFDKTGTYDIVLGKYQDGKCYPVRGRQCSSQQMPFIKEKFPTFGEFAVADLDDIYGQSQLDEALHYSASTFSSSILLSGKDGFHLERLPIYAQFGPLNGIVVADVDGDKNLDIVAAGNNFGAEVETVRYDGGRGVVLLGDGAGNFRQLSPAESGFFVNSDVKDILQVGKYIVVSSNNAIVRTFVLQKVASGQNIAQR